jgi:rod shape-determining protein MreC
MLDTTNYQTPMYNLTKAQIIGRDPSNINGYLYINLGSKQGLCIDQPVISVAGLIGLTKYVSPDYSIVETLENNGFAVSALDANTDIHGIVKKRRDLIFDFVRIEDEINLGDSLYTSGMSDLFPEGILIGTVQKIGPSNHLFFKPVFVKPSVQINRINYVYIVHRINATTSSDKEVNSRLMQQEGD